MKSATSSSNNPSPLRGDDTRRQDLVQVEQDLRHLLNEVQGSLPNRDLQHVGRLIAAGEYGVALDVLCTQLYEYDKEVSPDTYRTIVDLARVAGSELGCCERLRVRR